MTQTDRPPVHVMAKPTGARCNLRCDYCFFLKKERLYPGSSFRMTDEVLESYVRQVLEANDGPEVTVAWQGGEPTLMGLDFFRRAVELERKHQKPGTRVLNTLQTNGVHLDAEWCAFLRENGFLVGLSLDGPRELHDAYRHDRRGGSVFDRVAAAARLMGSEGVDFNVLCTVNAANGSRPLEVYRFFRDALEASYLQFIPLVERDNDTGFQEGTAVTARSVGPEQYGRFLNAVFDEWVRRDVGRTFVLNFDWLLGAWVYGEAPVCVSQPTCGQALVLEHNGDLYSCDHFVEPSCRLGNLLETPLAELAWSAQQRRFGEAKRDTLPRLCRECEFLFACHGECPKNRVLETPDGEPGLNWLCAGLKGFFGHTRRPMQLMADLVHRGQRADLVMGFLAEEEERFAATGRNDPCPCGSGKKFKACHLAPLPSPPPSLQRRKQVRPRPMGVPDSRDAR